MLCKARWGALQTLRPMDTPNSQDLFEWESIAPVSRLLGANTLDACLELVLPHSDLGMASPGLPPG